MKQFFSNKKNVVLLVVTILVVGGIIYFFTKDMKEEKTVELGPNDISEAECKSRYEAFVAQQNVGTGSIKKNKSTYASFVAAGKCRKCEGPNCNEETTN